MLTVSHSGCHSSRIRDNARSHSTGLFPAYLFPAFGCSCWDLVSFPCHASFLRNLKFSSIAGSVFGNQLSKNLAVYNLSPDIVQRVKQSVTAIFQLPVPLQAVVVKAYISAIRYAFIIVVPGSGITIISSLFVKGWNLKERGVKLGAAAV
jgi:hypothetical protein